MLQTQFMNVQHSTVVLGRLVAVIPVCNSNSSLLLISQCIDWSMSCDSLSSLVSAFSELTI